MKAALLAEYHGDFVISDLPDPVPSAPDDVIVRVGAAGFCRTDIHMWEGQFADLHKSVGIDLPFVCGHESAGWIESVGTGVRHLQIGQAVILHPLATCGHCRACRDGNDMHCTGGVFPGVLAPGGFAEYVKTNARAIVPIPDGLTPLDVAPLADAGLTAYRAVKKAIPLAYPGSHTVVLGAGGLGHIGIQALRALSQTEITVVDISSSALAAARGWGADHVVQAQADRSHIEAIKDITGGGAQVVLDYVGEGGAERDAVEILAANGVDFMVGYGGRLDIDILTQALFPETSFVGNICGTYNELVELVALARRGAVKLTCTAFPLSGINDALNRLRTGAMLGRGVLVPNES